MLIVHVHVHVVSDHVEDFIAATAVNASASRQEPGVLRFDLLREEGATDRFVLVEIYRNDEAAALHKETPHYATWRDAVAPWMAEPRKGQKLRIVSAAPF